MRFLDPEFRYNKGQQQQEVLGIGAWDPDAIMVVQTIDSRRKVMKSWVRNPHEPNEVWMIIGDCDFENLELSDVPEENILNKIKLKY